MTVSLAVLAKNTEADATARLFDGGQVRVYSGSVPANADAALGGATLLATLTFSNPSGAASSGGVFTASAIASGTCAATGTASFYRILKSDGTTVVSQGTVTATGGGGDMTFPTVSFVANATISLSSHTYTRP